MRTTLAHTLQTQPTAIKILRNKTGKPELPIEFKLAFNLSHSENIAYLITTDAGKVGIDVEITRSIDDTMLLANQVFSSSEISELLSTPQNQERSKIFLQCWTRKEALVKTLALGINQIELRNLEVGTSTLPITITVPDAKHHHPVYIRTIDTLPREIVSIGSTIPFDEIKLITHSE